MMSENYISSVQNARVKHVVALSEKSAVRRRDSLFVVEGQRELQHCVAAGYEPHSVFYCEKLAARPAFDGDIVFSVSTEVYERMAYRGGTEGVVAVFKSRPMDFGMLKLPDAPLIVVLEGVEKPGNLGAVLRSADAAGAAAVVVCDPLTDLYNPNIIRSSIGAVFTVPTIACTSGDCINFLKSHGIRILTAQLQDSSYYYDTDMLSATAIVMGTESKGLTEQWRQAADAHICIPMLGSLDSLNVSVSAAILLYEAVRQRQCRCL